MNYDVERQVFRHPFLFILGLAMGYGIVWADRVIFSHALGRPTTIDEPGVFIVTGLLTALPFLVLYLRAKQHIMLWLISVFLSAWLAWWWLQKGIAYQRSPDGSGVDMGGAMLMLLSPFVITAACFWLAGKLGGRGTSGS